MRTALKEWAVVVDALGRGEQIIILRKGGIHDQAGLFKPEHDRFWLFPTLFHQQAGSVVEHARVHFQDRVEPSLKDDYVKIEYLAEVSEAIEIRSCLTAENLRGQHIWKNEVIKQRFEWGKQRSVYVLLLRIFKTDSPVEMERIDAYAGCRSWINLESDISTDHLRPVLTDEVFGDKVNAARDALILSLNEP